MVLRVFHSSFGRCSMPRFAVTSARSKENIFLINAAVCKITRNIVFAATLSASGLMATNATAVSSDDQLWGRAALSALHDLAVASARLDRAGKDRDRYGCKLASQELELAANKALEKLRMLSFEAIDSRTSIGKILRLTEASSSICPDEMVVRIQMLPMIAGQAILGFRWAYAIGRDLWYKVDKSGTIEQENPLEMAKKLRDQDYSWVDLRLKGMLNILVPDWKAEMASRDPGDPTIDKSGSSLTAVEVGYRRVSSDQNTIVTFYRAKEDAESAAKDFRSEVERNAKSAATRQKPRAKNTTERK
jgi:hypothetical protein